MSASFLITQGKYLLLETKVELYFEIAHIIEFLVLPVFPLV